MGLPIDEQKSRVHDKTDLFGDHGAALYACWNLEAVGYWKDTFRLTA